MDLDSDGFHGFIFDGFHFSIKIPGGRLVNVIDKVSILYTVSLLYTQYIVYSIVIIYTVSLLTQFQIHSDGFGFRWISWIHF